jgi:hypothetical protein
VSAKGYDVCVSWGRKVDGKISEEICRAYLGYRPDPTVPNEVICIEIGCFLLSINTCSFW